jgi:hypothetical protein
MSLIDRYDIYKNYLHDDNWMSESEVRDYLNQEEFAKTCQHESTSWINCKIYCAHCGKEL